MGMGGTSALEVGTEIGSGEGEGEGTRLLG